MPHRQTHSFKGTEFYQFNINIDEADQIDNEAVSDGEVTSSHDDLQLQNLTQNQLEELFSRIGSELVAESTDEQEIFQRKATVKAPKTNIVIKVPFPPSSIDRQQDADIGIEQLKQLAKQSISPLFIERYSPNYNEINHPVSTITLTFNQSMISISSLVEQKNPEDLGISLFPIVEGQWRWIDAKTIQFEAKHRLPYSTKYIIRVDKETCMSTIRGNSSKTKLFFTVIVCRKA